MWVVGEQPGEGHARQGRWLARLFGPPAISGRLVARAGGRPFRVGGRRVMLRATIGELSPASALSPRVEAKYRAYFVRLMAALKAHHR